MSDMSDDIIRSCDVIDGGKQLAVSAQVQYRTVCAGGLNHLKQLSWAGKRPNRNIPACHGGGNGHVPGLKTPARPLAHGAVCSPPALENATPCDELARLWNVEQQGLLLLLLMLLLPLMLMLLRMLLLNHCKRLQLC